MHGASIRIKAVCFGLMLLAVIRPQSFKCDNFNFRGIYTNVMPLYIFIHAPIVVLNTNPKHVAVKYILFQYTWCRLQKRSVCFVF